MADIAFTFPNGVRGTLGEDGKISILGQAPTADQRPSALSGPGATDPDEPSPLAKPTGRVYRGIAGDTNPAPAAADISAPTEAPLGKEDPIGNAIVGAGALKAGATAARGIGGLVGQAVEGATAAGVPVLAETGDPRQAARAALAGSAISPVVHALPDLPGAVGDAAKARNLARTETALTGGSTSKAAKAVVAARDILRETAEAHPDLQRAILTGSDEAKHTAISSKLDALTAANDADVGQIAAHHPEAIGGRIPAGKLYEKLRDFAQSAHDKGDESLLDATKSAIDSVQRFEGNTGTISPEQLRGIRNGLAKKIAGAAPLSTVSREAGAVKGVINSAIEDIADETPGVNVAALKMRNRQIASLLPAQSFLEEEAEKSARQAPRGPVGKLVDLAGKVDIQHPLHNITAPVLAGADAAAPRVDLLLSKLAGSTGPAGVQALKAVALRPTRETLQAAVRAGVSPQIALQVARLGQAPAGAQ